MFAQFYLGMVIVGFSTFMVTLMSFWIWTRGWEFNAAPAVQPVEHQKTHAADAPRLAA